MKYIELYIDNISLEYVWRAIVTPTTMLKILCYPIKRLSSFQTMVFRVGCSLLPGMSPSNIVAT